MLTIENISKIFISQSQHAAVKNLNLEVRKGEFLSLLGPSGCGKTTLLRMIAGLESPSSGKILFSGQDITQWPAQRRPFNLIFQKYALFPHLNIFENIAFGLRVKNVPESEINQKVQEVLAMINLQNLATRFPSTLSGGQAQRVALARALVNKPDVLLLDEPLSALDKNMRSHLQTELRQLQKSLGITFIFVTHDQEEAFAMSDRIALMNNGEIVQLATPAEIYNNPRCLFSLEFIGSSSKLQVRSFEHQYSNQYKVQLTDGQQLIATAHPSFMQNKSQDNWIYFRPEQTRLSRSNNSSSLKAKMRSQIFKGDHQLVEMCLENGENFWAQLPNEESLDSIHPIDLHLDFQNTLLFNGSSLNHE